jgi:protein JSN1
LRFGSPATDFLFEAMVDRLWEIAQGRFGARSMRACLESQHITLNQQRKIATAIVLNSIPLATNPNGALLLTWLLDTSNFPSRYTLLAPRFTPHLSHLCTHKLASLTVLRIVNQKVEPDASVQVVEALFSSPNDHVLTDVLGDQVNGVAVVHKILTSPFVDPDQRPTYVEATKRVLIELKVIATQAYRRLIEEVGLPVPNLQPTYNGNTPQPTKTKYNNQNNYGVPGLPAGYPSTDQGLASMMAALQMGGQNAAAGPPRLQIDPGYAQVQPQNTNRARVSNPPSAFSPTTDPFNPFAMRSSEASNARNGAPRRQNSAPSPQVSTVPFGTQSPSLNQAANLMNVNQPPPYNGMPAQNVPPHVYQAYMYQMYQQNSPNMSPYHA